MFGGFGYLTDCHFPSFRHSDKPWNKLSMKWSNVQWVKQSSGTAASLEAVSGPHQWLVLLLLQLATVHILRFDWQWHQTGRISNHVRLSTGEEQHGDWIWISGHPITPWHLCLFCLFTTCTLLITKSSSGTNTFCSPHHRDSCYFPAGEFALFKSFKRLKTDGIKRPLKAHTDREVLSLFLKTAGSIRHHDAAWWIRLLEDRPSFISCLVLLDV